MQAGAYALAGLTALTMAAGLVAGAGLAPSGVPVPSTNTVLPPAKPAPAPGPAVGPIASMHASMHVDPRRLEPAATRPVPRALDPDESFEGFDAWDADAIDVTERVLVFEPDGSLAPAHAAALGTIARMVDGSGAPVDAEACAAADDARGERLLRAMGRAFADAGLPVGSVSLQLTGCRLPWAVVLRAGA